MVECPLIKRCLEQGLIAKRDISGEEQSLAFSAHHDPGRPERMPGIEKLEAGGGNPRPQLLERRPLDFPVIAESLKKVGDIVHLIVRKQGVLRNPEFFFLADHHVD